MLLRHRLSFSLSTCHRTLLVPNADRLERPGPSCRSGYRWRVVDYMPLLRELAPIEPPLFIFGGIAEAVLLDRALSPAHGDVDVLIRRDELESRTAQLAEHGFHDFAVHYEPRPGSAAGARKLSRRSGHRAQFAGPRHKWKSLLCGSGPRTVLYFGESRITGHTGASNDSRRIGGLGAFHAKHLKWSGGSGCEFASRGDHDPRPCAGAGDD